MRPCLIAPRLSCGCSEAEHHHAANAQCSLDVPFDKGELAKRNEYISELRSKPMSEMLELLRNYILAKTAQDCSMMFTLQQTADACESARGSDGTGAIHDVETGLSFVYQMRFVDLDVKPITKIARHYQDDLERVHAWHLLSRKDRCAPKQQLPSKHKNPTPCVKSRTT
mmetsp:Transcript_34315/g.87752  ORF Transcript_34315/g.87752 Transcript_34315/m.87752 type:complete len:169 (-) Transcript_34315:260-766(-)